MKSQLRKLNLIFRFTKLNPEMFYAVSFTESSIVLQGHNSKELKACCRKYPRHKESQYLEYRKNDIEIVLT
jgi:hypothetical protein